MSAAPAAPVLERQLREVTALNATLQALTSRRDLPEILRIVLEHTKHVTSAEGLSLLLYDRERDEIVFAATETLQENTLACREAPLPPAVGGLMSPDRLIVPVRGAERVLGTIELAHDTGLLPRSMLCVPMVHRDTLHGVIQVINKLDGSAFDDHELRLVQRLADHAAIAIENASLYRQAQQAALTDDLTGLGNTRHFNRVLPALLARGGPVSLAVLDLDGLKAVVDRYGHLVGSRAIAEVGHVIGGRLRPGDVAARFGGDELVVILPATDTTAARTIAEGLREAIAACAIPGDREGKTLTVSIGVASFPDHADDAEGLFRAADAAMYAVKRSTKNGVAGGRGRSEDG